MKKNLSKMLILSMIYNLVFTYNFSVLADAETQISGNITASAIDISASSEINYMIDGKTLTSDSVEIINNSNFPITVGVADVQKTIGTIQDVLPDEVGSQEQWFQLGRAASNSKIALGLKHSSGDYLEQYLVDTLYFRSIQDSESPIYLVSLGASSNIGYQISGFHGLAFDSDIQEQYKIVWDIGLYEGSSEDSGSGETEVITPTPEPEEDSIVSIELSSEGEYPWSQVEGETNTWRSIENQAAGTTSISTWTITVDEDVEFTIPYYAKTSGGYATFSLSVDNSVVKRIQTSKTTDSEYVASLTAGTHTISASFWKNIQTELYYATITLDESLAESTVIEPTVSITDFDYDVLDVTDNSLAYTDRTSLRFETVSTDSFVDENGISLHNTYNVSALSDGADTLDIPLYIKYVYGNSRSYGKVVGIKSGAFKDHALTTANIKYVSSIPMNAFRNCTQLSTVNISDSVTEIGTWAFVGCTGLTEITIPSSVTSIAADAFSGCDNLTTIHYSGTAEGAPWGATNATVVTE